MLLKSILWKAGSKNGMYQRISELSERDGITG